MWYPLLNPYHGLFEAPTRKQFTLKKNYLALTQIHCLPETCDGVKLFTRVITLCISQICACINHNILYAHARTCQAYQCVLADCLWPCRDMQLACLLFIGQSLPASALTYTYLFTWPWFLLSLGEVTHPGQYNYTTPVGDKLQSLIDWSCWGGWVSSINPVALHIGSTTWDGTCAYLRPFHTSTANRIQCALNVHWLRSHLMRFRSMCIQCALSESTSRGGLEPNCNRIVLLFIE